MSPELRTLRTMILALMTASERCRVTEQAEKIRAVESYLAEFEQPQRDTLERLRGTLRKILPHAHEAMKYGMPAFLLDGTGVAGYAGFKAHCSYFPMSSSVLDAAGDAVAKYSVSKGTLQFPVDRPLPVGLVRKLVKLRLAEISDVASGTRREYFPDGRLKAVGKMKNGLVHGRWQWFRSDGTLLRTGAFSQGERTGTWETWDRDGTLVSSSKA